MYMKTETELLLSESIRKINGEFESRDAEIKKLKKEIKEHENRKTEVEEKRREEITYLSKILKKFDAPIDTYTKDDLLSFISDRKTELKDLLDSMEFDTTLKVL